MAHKYSYKNISYSDHARRRKVDTSQIHQNDEGFGGKPSTRLRYFRKWAFGWPWIRGNSQAKFETLHCWDKMEISLENETLFHYM